MPDDPLDPGSASADEFLTAVRQVRKALYWEKKDIASYLLVARHLLKAALAEVQANGENASDYRARALGLSFDIASFTWAGWDEEGIEITPALQAIGLAAARLNAQLASSGDQPTDVRLNAFWVLGAQLMAAGDLVAARSAWREAREFDEEHRGRGLAAWMRLLDVMEGGDPATLDAALAELDGHGGDLAATADQIRSARKVFRQ